MIEQPHITQQSAPEALPQYVEPPLHERLERLERFRRALGVPAMEEQPAIEVEQNERHLEEALAAAETGLKELFGPDADLESFRSPYAASRFSTASAAAPPAPQEKPALMPSSTQPTPSGQQPTARGVASVPPASTPEFSSPEQSPADQIRLLEQALAATTDPDTAAQIKEGINQAYARLRVEAARTQPAALPPASSRGSIASLFSVNRNVASAGQGDKSKPVSTPPDTRVEATPEQLEQLERQANHAQKIYEQVESSRPPGLTDSEYEQYKANLKAAVQAAEHRYTDARQNGIAIHQSDLTVGDLEDLVKRMKRSKWGPTPTKRAAGQS